MYKIFFILIGTILPSSFGYGYGMSGMGGNSGYTKRSTYGGGSSSHGYDNYHAPQPYKFGYDIKDGYGGGLYQKETGDEYGNKKGSYGYTDSYGIYRQVDYVADKNGFRATIKTNEPGTANQNPASVYIDSNAPAVQYASAEKYGSSGYGKKISASSSGGYGSGNSGYSGSMTAASSYIKSSPTYSDESTNNGQFGLYKSASHSTPQYSPAKTSAYKPTTTSTIIDNEKIKAIIAALSSPSTSSAPIYQMPAYYMEPKTVYKNIPYKASASNPVPILNIDAEQIQQLYGQHSLYQPAKSINQ